MKTRLLFPTVAAVISIGVGAGCGSAAKTALSSAPIPTDAGSASAPLAASSSSTSGAPPSAASSGGSSAASSGGSSSRASTAAGNALVAEAQSAAAGDIPDNQVFIPFADASAGYTFTYPEGWAQKGGGGDVTIRDKTNIVHIVVRSAAAPTPASVAAELAALARSTPTLKVTVAPKSVMVGSQRAIRAGYLTVSDANPVTGKTVTLVVDRYAVAHAGKVAVVDMATPRGVDNVDAYRMMIASLKWTR